jgi:predicted aspartyl protease
MPVMKQLVVVAAVIAAVVLGDVPGGPSSAEAQVFRWIDGEGSIHYSQGVESVPARFRDAAVIIGYERTDGPAPVVEVAPVGIGRVRFTPGQPIMVSVRINGSTFASLMLDTGATRTVINPKVLESVGVNYRDAQRGSIRGVTGEAPVLAVRVESIEASGARSGPLLVVSHDTGFGHGDGLLGRDFLDQFSVNIDNAAGLVTLTPK